MSESKSLKVSAIKEGTVVDHIPAESTLKVMQILKLTKSSEIVSVVFNLESKTMKKKGIIKIGGKNLSSKETEKIALIAPKSTMNIIKNYKVVDKIKLKIPQEIKGVVKCINPKCITNNEEVQSKFKIENKEPLKLRCEYCERVMSRDDLIIQ